MRNKLKIMDYNLPKQNIHSTAKYTRKNLNMNVRLIFFFQLACKVRESRVSATPDFLMLHLETRE